MNLMIGLSGKAGVGKDTAYERIVNSLEDKYSYQKMAFATRLKQLAATVYRVPVNKFHYNKDQICEKYGMTYRKLLHLFGTNFARDMVNPDFWVQQLAADYKQYKEIRPSEITIITDVRFDNEAKWIRSKGGIIIELSRNKSIMIDSDSTHKAEAGVSEELINHKLTNNVSEEVLQMKLEILLSPYFKEPFKC